MKKDILSLVVFWYLLFLMQGCGLNPNASESWKNDLPKNPQHASTTPHHPDSQPTDEKKSNTLRADRAPASPTPIVPILGDGKNTENSSTGRAESGSNVNDVRHLKKTAETSTPTCGAH